MTDDEFNAFAERATKELNQKQASLIESYRIGHYKDFWFDQTTGRLQFKDKKGRVVVEASVTPIGSFSMKSNTWQWSWANESLVESLREKAERLMGLGSLTGMNVFQMPTFAADEQMAWELAAMAVYHLQSLGCYRMPAKQSQLFVAIDDARSM